MTRQGSGRQKWIPKGESQENLEEEEKNVEPEMSTRQEGPYYDKSALLRIFAAAKVAAADKEEPPMQLTISERPEEDKDNDGGRTPGARRAMREQQKADKLKKRGSTDSIQEEDAAGEVDMTHSMSGYGQMSPMMMAYLQSMSYAANLTQMMYGASTTNTTVMLRNIPNRYTRDMLIDRLNEGYEGQYDFVYLPIDFNSKCNVGYAFINFKLAPVAAKFIAEFHGAKTAQCLPGFSSAKICEVSYARVQGRDANMENLRDEKFIDKLNERPEWQPLFFDDDGKEIPFSTTLGLVSEGKKKRTSRGSSFAEAAPQAPVTPSGAAAGYVMPPYGPMMYPPFAPMMPPAPPPTTLAGVLPGATPETMLMLKNVPIDFSREQLTEAFEKKYKGAFDFLFLPGDPKTAGSRGFCFINFRKVEKAKEFMADFDKKGMGECFGVESSEDKVCSVQPARLETIGRTIERLQAPDKKENKDKDEQGDKTAWYPQLFAPDGEPAPFPLLTYPPGAGGMKGVGKGGMFAGATPSAPSMGKDGKGKGKGKGKAKGANAAAAAAMMGYGFPPYGYPYPGQVAAYAAAYQRAAVQHAHAHAAAAAAAHAGQNSMLDTMAAAMKGGPGRAGNTKPMTDESKKNLKKQIEFYFSDDNLCKDVFLRSHMDASGWTSLDLISNFNQVRKYRASIDGISEALTDSTALEVDVPTRRVRLKDQGVRNKWAKASQELQQAASPKGGTSPSMLAR